MNGVWVIYITDANHPKRKLDFLRHLGVPIQNFPSNFLAFLPSTIHPIPAQHLQAPLLHTTKVVIYVDFMSPMSLHVDYF